eukprot:scaffold282813_cov24-Tisochrysis_lutea.AAC.3
MEKNFGVSPWGLGSSTLKMSAPWINGIASLKHDPLPCACSCVVCFPKRKLTWLLEDEKTTWCPS